MSAQHRAPHEPRVVMIKGGLTEDTEYDEAGESWCRDGVARGALTAFYIVLILMAGLYLAGLAVRHWPHS